MGGWRGRGVLVSALTIAFIVMLIVYLADIGIPAGSLEQPRYRASLSREAKISIERVYYNEAYPLFVGPNLTIRLNVGGVKANATIPYKPGEELKLGASVAVDIGGSGPWPIHIFDETLGREILVGVVDRSSDLIVQTGLYSALLSIQIVSKLRIEVQPSGGAGALVRLVYLNRSVEALDLGYCRAQGGQGCIYNIERENIAGYDLSFYADLSILRAKISNGVLIVSPYNNPHIFIPALALTFTLALALALHGGGERTKRVKRRRR